MDNFPNYSSISEIDRRISALEEEKAQLLELRKTLQDSVAISENKLSDSYLPDQKIKIFKSLFRGRSDVFAKRWLNKEGRSGYSFACNNEWVRGICEKPKIKCQDCKHRHYSILGDQVIYDHLKGHMVVGLYPLMHDNTCYFLAADFDKANWQEEVKALSRACGAFKIPHAIEVSRSGNGAHLWIFFTDRVLAKQARQLGFGLLDKAMEYYPNLSFDSYDRLFPNQDILPEGGFGNLIALPLQKEARAFGNTCFVDDDLNLIEDQWVYLEKQTKVSPQELVQLIQEISPSSSMINHQKITDHMLPWELTTKSAQAIENPPKKVSIILANHIYFELNKIPSALTAIIRRMASFSNPVFFKTQALRFSTHGIPRFITLARLEHGFLSLPRGCLDEVKDLLNENKISIEIDDQRQDGVSLEIEKSLIRLRKNQQTAVLAMFQHDIGVLHAPTAFGKTVTAIALIEKRKRNTLILVHSRQLLDQWKERLKSFLPDTQVGVIGGGIKKPSGIIDIATYQSLINKKDNTVADLVQNYGHVIVDECHHVSAPRFEMVMNEVRAKYILGLTATPERQDGHQKIIFMTVGPIRHKVKSDGNEKFEQQVIVHQLYDNWPISLPDKEQRPKISDAYQWLMDNADRTAKIVEDVLQSVQQSKHPIVLTERREHAEVINALLLEKGVESVVLKGAMRASERKHVEQHLATSKVVVATGKYVGEGFDLPRLDTLFLAMPIAWKGSLSQYAGRIHRESEGKSVVTIHDYVDCGLPMLQRMFGKREKSYKAMGYTVKFSELS